MVDSVEVPAVTNSDVVKNLKESGSGQMKQSVCTSVEVLVAAGTRILPVCAVSTDELVMETALSQEEIFESPNFVDASVSHICSVAHADVRTAEPVPTD